MQFSCSRSIDIEGREAALFVDTATDYSGEGAALLAFDSHGVNQSRWVNRTGDASCRRAVLSKMWQPQRGPPCALTGVPDLGIGHTWNTIATESLLDADFYLIELALPRTRTRIRCLKADMAVSAVIWLCSLLR